MKPIAIEPVSDLRPLGPHSRRRWPLGLLLTALLLGSLLWFMWPADQPNSLSESRLAGDRGPGCLRVILANDISGSMSKFSAPREDSLQQLLTWAPSNLRADDELAVLDFSGHAIVTRAPRSIGSGPGPRLPSEQFSGTSLSELLRTVGGLPATPCTSALVMLSDGVVTDLPDNPATARKQLVAAGLATATLLVPGHDIEIDPDWSAIYPYSKPIRFNGSDSNSTGLAIGRTLGKLTGQRLEIAK